MIQLASYALHKLFSEWQTEGYKIPLLNQGKVIKFSCLFQISISLGFELKIILIQYVSCSANLPFQLQLLLEI